jgi:hypothetical protein
MRRALWLASFAGVAGLATLVALIISPWSPAGPGKGEPPGPAAVSRVAPQLPVTSAALFSSGVGYFEREGVVEGDARIDMTFPVTDVNDLLKSMVLLDLGGGRIEAVSYDSHDPIDKTLKSFAVNLSRNPSFADILDQARGEKVEVVQQQAANQPGTLTGAIVGVEHQKQPAGKDATINVDVLNLWCAEGVRSVKLSEVQRLRFLNPVMESEFRKALDVLALSHDTQKKAVSLNFAGNGKRPVRVGYVVENPVWKTSYRLTINEAGKVYLQGWAVVENPTDEDWKDVRMALVSGRPISFQMDLYQPLYVPRPTVVPELFASLTPRTYEGGLLGKKVIDDEARYQQMALPSSPNNTIRPSAPQTNSYGGKASGPGEVDERKLKEMAEVWGHLPEGDRSQALEEMTRDMPPRYREAVMEYFRKLDYERLNLTRGVVSAASGMRLGDSFQYRIEHPVGLPRQKSAMLPIVTKDVEAQKVSIYNQATHVKFPLLGLKFKNTSGLHLMQGPITVFENNVYAGDSRILDLQPNEERLLSYAVDLGAEVETVSPTGSEKITKLKLNKGILFTTTKARETKVYKAKNRSQQDRMLIIEHPYRPVFTLVSKEQPSERARDVYRFEVKLPAGASAETEVSEERDIVSTVQLSNSDEQTMRYFISQTVISDKVKAALEKAIELKSALVKTQQEREHVEKDLKLIVDDQTRLRANLKEMPRDAAAYKKYLDKFDKQEAEIEELQTTIKKRSEAELKQRQEYEAFLGALDVE